MQIRVIFTGKTEEGFVSEGMQVYSTRIKRYIQWKEEVIPTLKNAGSLDEVTRKKQEGEKILALIEPGQLLVLLDERGKLLNSVQFSETINKWMHTGVKVVNLVIGGPYGFSKEVYTRADFQLSLSPMTFSHQLIRVVLLEQVYRAFTILKGEPYHHA